MSKITADDVRKVAKLARLDLPDDTIRIYNSVFTRCIDHFHCTCCRQNPFGVHRLKLIHVIENSL